MALHDFRCDECGTITEALGVWNPKIGRVDPIPCEFCGSPAERIWLSPPSLVSDEKIPAHMEAAIGKGKYETRHEYEQAIDAKGLVPVRASEASDLIDKSIAAREHDGTPRNVAEERAAAEKRKEGTEKIIAKMWKQADGLLPPVQSPSKASEKVGAAIGKGGIE